MTPSPSNVPRVPLVLVVDDDPDTREIYATWLDYSGLRVVQSARADDAIIKAQTLRPNVVATDVGLPDLNGYQLCERLKSDPRTCSIPVIMVTGWAVNQERARQAGCDSVLIKPCTPDVLFEEIQRLLNLRRKDGSRQM